MVEFDETERCPLRILSYRKAASSRNVHRRRANLAAKLGRLPRHGICVIHCEIDQPVRWHFAHFRRWLVHSSGWPIAVHERGIGHRAHLLNFLPPTEKSAVEVSGLGRIFGRQFVPAKRIGGIDNSRTSVCSRLPQGKDGAGWILNNRHSAKIHNIEWLLYDAA